MKLYVFKKRTNKDIQELSELKKLYAKIEFYSEKQVKYVITIKTKIHQNGQTILNLTNRSDVNFLSDEHFKIANTTLPIK